jgi:hypothetical protein
MTLQAAAIYTRGKSRAPAYQALPATPSDPDRLPALLAAGKHPFKLGHHLVIIRMLADMRSGDPGATLQRGIMFLRFVPCSDPELLRIHRASIPFLHFSHPPFLQTRILFQE